MAAALAQKTIVRLGGKQQHSVYAALHRAKVTSARFQEKQIRSRGEEGIQFGTLHLTMDDSRQRMAEVRLGILDVRREVNSADVAALSNWIVLDRLSLLTGNFGSAKNTCAWVSALAHRSGATSNMPLYQSVRCPHHQDVWLHPTFFILYACYRRIVIKPPEVADIPDDLQLGDDLWTGMLPLRKVPTWSLNEQGSAFAGFIGSIHMKPPDWKRWFHHCFQTILWLGTSTPSYCSQLKRNVLDVDRSRGKGEGKGGKSAKGKGKGKGKGGSGSWSSGSWSSGSWSRTSWSSGWK